MIQIRKFGNPGVKIFQGHPAAVDHGALFKRRPFAFQDVANCLGHDAARSDRLGQNARPDHVTDRKNFWIRCLVVFINFNKAVFSSYCFGHELKIRHITNRNNDRICSNFFSGGQLHTRCGDFLSKYRPKKFGPHRLGRLPFFTERRRFLNI